MRLGCGAQVVCEKSSVIQSRQSRSQRGDIER